MLKILKLNPLAIRILLGMTSAHLLCKVREVGESWFILGVKNLRNLHKTKEQRAGKYNKSSKNKENFSQVLTLTF